MSVVVLDLMLLVDFSVDVLAIEFLAMEILAIESLAVEWLAMEFIERSRYFDSVDDVRDGDSDAIETIVEGE